MPSVKRAGRLSTRRVVQLQRSRKSRDVLKDLALVCGALKVCNKSLEIVRLIEEWIVDSLTSIIELKSIDCLLQLKVKRLMDFCRSSDCDAK
jgi:hypothetical protein